MGRPRLWLNALVPDHPTLAVTGLLQPDSGIFTLAHWQAVLFARLLRLRANRPERAAPSPPGYAPEPVNATRDR
ncbi:hypothetical protein GCM10029963_66860 [Micromonospora andamanensis]